MMRPWKCFLFLNKEGKKEEENIEKEEKKKESKREKDTIRRSKRKEEGFWEDTTQGKEKLKAREGSASCNNGVREKRKKMNQGKMGQLPKLILRVVGCQLSMIVLREKRS